jgi:hypothetical protein
LGADVRKGGKKIVVEGDEGLMDDIQYSTGTSK